MALGGDFYRLAVVVMALFSALSSDFYTIGWRFSKRFL